jgi:putative spermidine/putrescine transport system permease protein
MAPAGPRPTGWWLLILPAFLPMTAFYVAPIAQVLAISFTEPEPGLGNYERLFTSESVQRVIVTTLRICAITTVLALILGYALAYKIALASEQARRRWILAVLVPLWISVLVRAFAWVTLLRRQGLVNDALIGAGVITEPLQLVWNEFGIVVGMVHSMVPYAVLPILASMREIEQRLLADARGLGASRSTVFRRVFLPLSLPGLIAAGVLVFIFSLGFYITPSILGGGKTLMVAEMVAEWIGLQILDLIRWGLGTMMATVLVVALLATLLVFSRVVDLRRVFGRGPDGRRASPRPACKRLRLGGRDLPGAADFHRHYGFHDRPALPVAAAGGAVAAPRRDGADIARMARRDRAEVLDRGGLDAARGWRGHALRHLMLAHLPTGDGSRAPADAAADHHPLHRPHGRALSVLRAARPAR